MLKTSSSDSGFWKFLSCISDIDKLMPWLIEVDNIWLVTSVPCRKLKKAFPKFLTMFRHQNQWIQCTNRFPLWLAAKVAVHDTLFTSSTKTYAWRHRQREVFRILGEKDPARPGNLINPGKRRCFKHYSATHGVSVNRTSRQQETQ